MLLTLRLAILLSLLSLWNARCFPQDAVQPTAMTDPLRPLRIEQRDAWQRLFQAQRDEKSPPAALSAAWALFHQFDVDYFSLLEAEPEGLLKVYERDTEQFLDDLDKLASEDNVAELARMELKALLDDIEANRLQNTRPEGVPGDSPELTAWNDKFTQFQRARAIALQDRGKLVLTLYRAGDVDVARLCLVLLERQIAERVLLEHQEMIGGADRVTEFVTRRKKLYDKQVREWQQLQALLPDTDSRTPQVPLGEQICALQLLSIDLLQARLPETSSEKIDDPAEDKSAPLVVKLLTAYRNLHRGSVEQHGAGKLTIEQLARLHDLRMYTTIWSHPAAPPADVAADSVEVATMWAKLHAELEKKSSNEADITIALAKKLEAEIAHNDLVGVPEPATPSAPTPVPEAPKPAE